MAVKIREYMPVNGMQWISMRYNVGEVMIVLGTR